ncbi:hypothetical protein SteCoe_36329 [Stentor coeruleus]|uniref:Uncharacterized protein n=1 Tax=Stentor coeruleus TaxID=5963 RepID=A0A1R2AQL1_9CILI|nr:hypothetical protein SteCoe_36329 [Stentor coeruleus]
MDNYEDFLAADLMISTSTPIEVEFDLDYLNNEPETSDIHYSNYSSSISHPNQPGRRKNPFTGILDEFNTGPQRKPKKEFFNAFIIRAIKRAFRAVISGKTPRTTCIAIDIKNATECNLWSKIQEIYRKNPNLVDVKSKTVDGPLTDGKSKRDVQSEGYRSFNNAFCKEFFKNSLMRKAFHFIIELIYCEYSPKRCCERFKFNCCNMRDPHCFECDEKWSKLREYFRNSYFKDLDVDDEIFENIIENPSYSDIEMESYHQ